MRKDSTLKLVARQKEPRPEHRDRMRKDSRLKCAVKRKGTRLTTLREDGEKLDTKTHSEAERAETRTQRQDEEPLER